MKKPYAMQIAKLFIATLAGLTAGLLLQMPVHSGLIRGLPQIQEEAVAVFSLQGQPSQSFSIEPVSLPAEGDEMQTAETPAPDASAFSIVPLGMGADSDKGRILIYHTHTYEAYEQQGASYQETERWRTADSAFNMVRVGEELSLLLRSLGYTVVHDTTAFEPPDLSSAYGRSLAMLESRLKAGESYDLYIDLHRDAYVEGQAGDNTVSIGGTEAARLMLLIGKGEGYTDAGYELKPDWEANLSCAQSITDALNNQNPGFCKDVRLKSGRFNQHVAKNCVLIEVGNNRNTLQQALAAMPYLADAIQSALQPVKP